MADEKNRKRAVPGWLLLVMGLVLLGAVVGGVKYFRGGLPEGFASTHGRAEATEAYVSTKWQGRIQDVLVREGDMVEAGQVLARMDTRTLEAQLRHSEAEVQRNKDAKNTAITVVAQRQSDLDFAKISFERAANLLKTNAVSQQAYDKTKSEMDTAEAAWEQAKSQVLEAQTAIDAAEAQAQRLRIEIEDGILKAPFRGRIQYRLAEPGEVLPAGGRVLDLVNLSDVYLIFYLPEQEAGRTGIGSEARIIFDAFPNATIPATVYFVAAGAQFTPKTVETKSERQKLAFEVRARINAELLRKYEARVKTGLPGVVYVQLDQSAPWPEHLQVKLPEPKVAQQ